jgi:hypothetical protein
LAIIIFQNITFRFGVGFNGNGIFHATVGLALTCVWIGGAAFCLAILLGRLAAQGLSFFADTCACLTREARTSGVWT